MDFVQPIRDKKQLEKMKSFLLRHSQRDYVLFILGIDSGLGISDLLNLTVEDVKGKDAITIREQKTGKSIAFPLSGNAKKVVADYLKLQDLNTGVLFPTRNGEAISRVQAYRILKDAAGKAKIKDSIGTHSLRKTFAYHAYQQGADITKLQKLFNHSAPSVTLRYIGVEQDELDDLYRDVNFYVYFGQPDHRM